MSGLTTGHFLKALSSTTFGFAAHGLTHVDVGAAPTAHNSTSTTYGVASATDYGHVKIGTGIGVSTGTISVSYGTAAGTACQGNDSRLSDTRTPKAHAFIDSSGHTASNLTAGHFLKALSATTYGFAAHGLAAADVGAAPSSHTSSVATASVIGHVSVSTGLSVSAGGALSVNYGTAAGTSCQGNDSRLSNARTPVAHAVNASTYGYGDATNAGHLRVGNGIAISSGTISIASHAGTAGSVGTITVTSGTIGVNLGTTSTTAFRGDYGNTAYSHVTSNGSSHSYINQSVTTSSGPTFASLTLTGSLSVAGDISGNSKVAIRTSDAWLRLNPTSQFTSGIYSPKGLRADGGWLQVLY